VTVEGLVNVHDLGGLCREHDSFTMSGVFFRSENVDAVTKPGWDQFRALGVRTVVDPAHSVSQWSEPGIAAAGQAG
jgi:hypothetical protein